MLIPLRNYSNYSICESNIKIDDLVNYAFQNKLPALALTDYKLLSGTLDFSVKCQKKGIQPIIGLDVDYLSYLGNISRITLLSKTEKGYKNLNILSTKINTENNFVLSNENLYEFSEDNILILGGLYSIFDDIPKNKNNLEKLLNEFLALQKNFKEDIFFEYDSNLDNSFLNEISHKLKIKCFKSSFSFYKKKR